MKKKIGISFSESNFDNYPAWFTPNDLQDDLELIVLSFKMNNEKDISQCDGFVLTGGIDIDPEFYGGPGDYSNKPPRFLSGRDQFEAGIYRYAKLHKLPVLGICRGMQLINVLEGGGLIQDLGEKGNSIHKKEETDKQHEVHVVNGSLLRSITGLEKGKVNSAHHQAVDQYTISDQLVASARMGEEPAIVEALEFKQPSGKPFMLCVQWHPERMADKEQNPLAHQVKTRFLAEVRKPVNK